MNARLKKELPGSLYYIKPTVLSQMIEGLISSLIKQGFSKIYLITGHGGSKHVEVLGKIEKKYKNVSLFIPYDNLSVHAHHADEYEASLLWACYPEEEKKSRAVKISSSDDFIKYQGYDARETASLAIGKKMLKEIIKNFNSKIL
jgi:creatinine amidohydrolase/Fe(II)-dependent formamide hydrolase-like protein